MIRVRAAAIRTRTNPLGDRTSNWKYQVFEGLAHTDIRNQGGITGEEGFVLTDGRFVGRIQAARIAVDARQAPRTVLYQTTGLSSSDLVNNYPPEEPAPTETK